MLGVKVPTAVPDGVATTLDFQGEVRNALHEEGVVELRRGAVGLEFVERLTRAVTLGDLQVDGPLGLALGIFPPILREFLSEFHGENFLSRCELRRPAQEHEKGRSGNSRTGPQRERQPLR